MKNVRELINELKTLQTDVNLETMNRLDATFADLEKANQKLGDFAADHAQIIQYFCASVAPKTSEPL